MLVSKQKEKMRQASIRDGEHPYKNVLINYKHLVIQLVDNKQTIDKLQMIFLPVRFHTK